jgi:hypothetical protein
MIINDLPKKEEEDDNKCSGGARSKSLGGPCW